MKKFQSLKGKIQTIRAVCKYTARSRFQSLKGKIQTAKRDEILSRWEDCFNPLKVRYKLLVLPGFAEKGVEFQSLKGKIQTSRWLPAQQNWPCFNPLKVRYKHAASRWTTRFLRSFNPLKVRYKPMKFGIFIDGELGFNPLKVRYKRMRELPLSERAEVFQSLKGKIQTALSYMNSSS